MRAIRASEIGAFLYCRRAWWYQKQGIKPENQADLSAGVRLHHQHSRRVLSAALLRGVAFVLLLASLVLVTIFLVGKVL